MTPHMFASLWNHHPHFYGHLASCGIGQTVYRRLRRECLDMGITLTERRGRPRRLEDEQLRELFHAGYGLRAMSRALRCSTWTAHHALKRLGLSVRRRDAENRLRTLKCMTARKSELG